MNTANTQRDEAPASELRPAIVTDEHLDYLDDLRESGETNMFGAGPYVQREFGVSRDEARAICLYWMKTFPRAKVQS